MKKKEDTVDRTGDAQRRVHPGKCPPYRLVPALLIVALFVVAAGAFPESVLAGRPSSARTVQVTFSLDRPSADGGPRWRADLPAEATRGPILTAVRPGLAGNLALPPLLVRLSGDSPAATVEVSPGPGLPFVPVHLVHGTGRLPISIPDVASLSRLRLRFSSSQACAVSLEPEQPLTLRPVVQSGGTDVILTNWGDPGTLEVSAVDAAGQDVDLRTQDQRPLLGTGWRYAGTLDPASSLQVQVLPAAITSYPITVKARIGSGATAEAVLYSTEGGSGLCATPGKDGAGNSITGVVNTYYPLTASVSAGATSIPVGSPQGASAPISSGDLLLLVQMQAALINSTNTSSYGDGSTGSGYTSLNGAGSYEYVVAAGPVSGGSVPIMGTGAGGGTLNAYSVSASTSAQGQETAQLIRVPQYTTVTIGPALTCLAWEGSVGGVLAFDASGAVTLSGTISVDGLGFRGGLQTQLSGITPAPSTSSYRITTPASPPTGCFAMKGEGIAGTPKSLPGANNGIGLDGYPNGDYAQGAPGNAGGGGNDSAPTTNSQNAGGAGGGNGGYGGQGGWAWSSSADLGGRPGAPVPDAPNLLVMGGGGGAGTRNNLTAGGNGSGAAGGGIVLIRALTVNGVGTISADGADAPTSQQDAAGGGGAGGTVLVYAATGSLSGLSVRANGGQGGDAWPAQDGSAYPGNRHGPGGGGGGGAILLSSTAGYAVSNGGMNGITTTYNDAYGSTPGVAGTSVATLTSSQIPGTQAGAQCPTPSTYITKASSAGTGAVAPGQPLTYTVTVTNTTASTWTGVGVNDPVPTGTTYVDGSAQVSALTTTTGSYADSFPNKTYTNSTGTLPWANSWSESGDGGGGATKGHIQVVQDPLDRSNYALRMDNLDTTRYVYRAQSLAGNTSATLRLLYRRYQMTSYDTVLVQVYYNGTWIPVRTYQGFTDNNGNPYITDSQFLNDAVDITPYISPSFSLRVIYGSVDPYYTSYIYFDNFEIDVQNAQTATTAGTAPPSLLSNCTLQPGQSVTLTYQVQVTSNPPAGLTSILNTATVTADGGAIEQSASVANVLLVPPVVSSPILSTDTAVAGTSSVLGGAVTVYQNGVSLGTATVGSDGRWTLAGISGLTPGASITATVTASGLTSSLSNAVVVQFPPPAVDSPIGAGDASISGTSIAPAGSTITVYSNGAVLGSTTVQGGGAWTLTGVSGLVGGEAITATAGTGPGQSPLSNTVVVTPAPPVITTPLLPGQTAVSGTSTAPSGSTVTVVIGGNVYTTSVQPGGGWSVGVPALLAGDSVSATVTAGGQTSAAATATVLAQSTPPIVTAQLDAGTSQTVYGSSVEAAGSTITVYVNGSSVGTTAVNADGSWSLAGVNLAAGQQVTATVQAAGKAVSGYGNTVTVSGTSGATPPPVITPGVAAGATSVSGTFPTATSGVAIDLYADGVYLGTTTTNASGAWTLAGLPALANGAILTATATQSGTGTSDWSAPAIVGTILDLMRDDSMTTLTAPPSTIFTHKPQQLPYPSLEPLGPNHVANWGEGTKQQTNGTSDDDKAYLSNVTTGAADPDVTVLTDNSRPLVFYQLLDNNTKTLKLSKVNGQIVFTIQ